MLCVRIVGKSNLFLIELNKLILKSSILIILLNSSIDEEDKYSNLRNDNKDI